MNIPQPNDRVMIDHIEGLPENLLDDPIYIVRSYDSINDTVLVVPKLLVDKGLATKPIRVKLEHVTILD